MPELRSIYNGLSESISDTAPTAEETYDVIGYADSEDAKAYALSTIPLNRGELIRTKIDIEEQRSPEIWRFTAYYELAAEAEVTVFPSFEAATASVHIDNSIATVGAFGPKADGTKLGKSNPIDSDGTTIRGADVLSVVFTKKVTQTFQPGFVTKAYETRLVEFSGCLNSTAFLGYGGGTVLFLGASGARNADLEWEITFSFCIKPNPPPMMVGNIPVYYDGIAGPVSGVGAWDVVWAVYETRQSGMKLVQVPVAVYVERIYKLVDLNLLGVTEA